MRAPKSRNGRRAPLGGRRDGSVVLRLRSVNRPTRPPIRGSSVAALRRRLRIEV